MGFKTILAVVGVNQFQEDIRHAIALSQSLDAHLSTAIIAMAAPPPIGSYAEVVSVAWLEERQGDLAKLEEEAQKLKDILRSSGLSHDVQELYTEFAWADNDIAQRALYADLTLLGRQAGQDDDLRNRILGGALFQSGTPVLFNPAAEAPTLQPRSVLIAWDSRVEAARAVRQAMPVLRSAADVHVTLVDPVAAPLANGEEPAPTLRPILPGTGSRLSSTCCRAAARPSQRP